MSDVLAIDAELPHFGDHPVYFPFLSGILDYQCASCDAPCCKNAVINVARSREIHALLQLDRSAALFAVPAVSGNGMLSIYPPDEYCRFFQQTHNAESTEHRCLVEAGGGRSSKPAGCRLFPFQQVRRAGPALTIFPDLLCPINVVNRPARSVVSRYDYLLDEMSRVALPKRGQLSLTAPSDMSWNSALLLEYRLLKTSKRYFSINLDSQTKSETHISPWERWLLFCVEQQKYTDEAMGLAHRTGKLAVIAEAAAGFIGSNIAWLQEKVTHADVDMLISVSGIVRMQMSPIARRAMPAVLLVLGIFYSSVVLPVSEQEKSAVRLLLRIAERQMPFLYALSRLLDRPIDVDLPLTKKNMPDRRGQQLLVDLCEAVLQNGQASISATLEQIIRAHTGGLQGWAGGIPDVHTVALVYAFGRALLQTGKFAPV